MLSALPSPGRSVAGVGNTPAGGVVESTPITGVTFDETSFITGGADSDNWPVVWADDGDQYTSWGDGDGWNNGSTDSGLGFTRLAGTAYDALTGTDLYAAGSRGCGDLCGKTYGIFCTPGGVLYAFISPNAIADSPGNFDRQRLYKSTDYGATWAEPSTRVEFTETTHNIAMPVFLQYGQANGLARDSYVYIYAVDIKDSTGGVIQDPGAIYLLRVPLTDIETQASYEWFTGTSASPSWGAFASRAAVFTDADGVGWSTGSVQWIPGLNRYVLITEHTASQAGNIRINEAPEPWGPWTQVFTQTGWNPSNSTHTNANGFFYNIMPKFISNGGLDFVLMMTGISEWDSWNMIEGTFTT